MSLFTKFKISENDIDGTTNPWGNYVNDLVKIYRTKHSSFDFTFSDGKVICSNYSKREYVFGNGQTFHHIYDSLYFFGLVDERYNEKDTMKNGWKIPLLDEFKTLDSWLDSDLAKLNIKNNFENNPEWFKKRIICAAGDYANRKNVRIEILDKIQDGIKKSKYSPKYNSLFEKMYQVFFNENNELEVESNEIKKLENMLRDSTFRFEDYKKTSSYNNLRNIFRKKLVDQVMEDYLNDSRNQNEQLKNFQHNEAAHIISFQRCYEEKLIDKITSPHNGMFIDPNLHTQFDMNNNVKINSNGEFIDTSTNEIIGRLDMNIKNNVLKIENFKIAKKYIED